MRVIDEWLLAGVHGGRALRVRFDRVCVFGRGALLLTMSPSRRVKFFLRFFGGGGPCVVGISSDSLMSSPSPSPRTRFPSYHLSTDAPPSRFSKKLYCGDWRSMRTVRRTLCSILSIHFLLAMELDMSEPGMGLRFILDAMSAKRNLA